MTYRISGLAPDAFAHLRGADEAALAAAGARRVVARSKPGYPCRISLEDAEIGESLILLNHVSHDVDTPFRSAFAIYVREDAGAAAVYWDELPPVLEARALSLRGFDDAGMLRDAVLVGAGEADRALGRLLDNPAIAYIDAHSAASGCFVARAERA